MNWGFVFVGVLVIRPLLLVGVFIEAPDSWKLPYGPE